ncbi:trehalose-phosphatase [Corynebacterium uropygiale]|uniref:Trehalose 6-phosphate phosphatase n=1 Tax=Corynebacterium uropygiale TaxID=1775911 RepID=A0A9X1U7V8_9CORY|nr:trehalose-phosphatase [Corynebacterium uropygiale]MCF4007147.1 trehalose-phosphatase [Corynebacterium uropygiale]
MTSIHDLATTAELLVVSDFDGTLAGFNPSDIYDVPISEESLSALRTLAHLPHTTVAVLSGRHLGGLKKVCPLEAPVLFAGSHGAETSGEPSGERGPDEQQQCALDALDARLAEIIAWEPRTYLERKPFHRVIHVAPFVDEDPSRAREVLDAALAVEHEGVSMLEGKNIVEFSASEENKGTWIASHRESLGATGVLFLGDDTTDETGFRILREEDLGVKVGEGDTAATERVADRDGVAALLSELAAGRTRWADGLSR